MDKGGRWAWPEPWNGPIDIFQKLAAFEQLEYRTGLRDKQSRHELETLCTEAQKRLADIEKDDLEVLYSWHLDGPTRIWCANYGGMMCVLWWDPTHTVYPTPLKGT